MYDILIKNADIFTGDEVIKRGFVGIKDGKIAYVGAKEPEIKAKSVINGERKAVMPGLVNIHTHSAMCAMRGYADDYSLNDWLYKKIFPVEANWGDGMLYPASLLGYAEMIRTGTVSCTDMYFFITEEAQAALDAGIYLNISNAAMCFDRGSYDFDKQREYHQSMQFINNGYHGADNGRIQLDASIHAEYTSFPELWRDFAAFAKEKNLNMHIHLSETQAEVDACRERNGKTPAEALSECGVFDQRTTAAHCVYLSENDIDILKSHNVTVAHNPVSNLKLASGIAPVRHYTERGLRVGLGTDGACSNNNYDLFEEMKLSALLQKGTTCDPSCAKVREALKMATEYGAYAQGRENYLGKIKEGFDASLIMVDLSSPMLYPIHNLESALVYSANGRDVCLTMVRGRILYKDGEYFTVDIEKIRHEFEKTVLPKLFNN